MKDSDETPQSPTKLPAGTGSGTERPNEALARGRDGYDASQTGANNARPKTGNVPVAFGRRVSLFRRLLVDVGS